MQSPESLKVGSLAGWDFEVRSLKTNSLEETPGMLELWKLRLTRVDIYSCISLFIFGKLQNEPMIIIVLVNASLISYFRPSFLITFTLLRAFDGIRCWNKNLQNPNLRMNFMVMQLRCGDGNLISPCYCCNFFGKISPSCFREKKIPSVGETQNASNIEFKVANRTPKNPPILPHLHHLQLAVF